MLYEMIVSRETKIAVIGLGYVGMPLALALAELVDVMGFDLNRNKIALYQQGKDPTGEISSEKLLQTPLELTSEPSKLQEAKFLIIAVPTPISHDKTPDLTSVEQASILVGSNLQKGSIVVYESTVYPGVTEDFCVPILEQHSGLVCGRDFFVGYSPERINPGDIAHPLSSIVKIVSGMDSSTLDTIARVYALIIEAGIHRAPSIKIAEAAKVAENSQRDINIAFMNELAMVFDRMNIDTHEVIQAMNTKWNALQFHPGLVGGHCISVDPYYFLYEAEKLGYHSQIIASGRRINDSLAPYLADTIVKQLILANHIVKQAKVVILGLTFKENVTDIRNSKTIDIVNRLQEYGIKPLLVDPLASRDETKRQYNLTLTDFEDIHDADCLVLAVAHQQYRCLSFNQWDALFKRVSNDKKVIVDVRSILDKEEFQSKGFVYWRL